MFFIVYRMGGRKKSTEKKLIIFEYKQRKSSGWKNEKCGKDRFLRTQIDYYSYIPIDRNQFFPCNFFNQFFFFFII